ncbi:MAG: hypothetical protein PHQ35_08255 [Phycisphaerae bacterium]|nr:hypothetical protein [Phycisphaerae bacterium]MDD5381481.1 hypothetical protein [Phycisphaerae bacterium]
MLRKEFLLATVVLFGAICPVLAAEGELHGFTGITYDTKYVWRGITVYGDKSAIHPFIDLDLFGTGFHLETIAHRANSSGYENGERWDYSPYYLGAFGIDQQWETRYKVGWRYFNYPDSSSHTRNSTDLQEVYAGFVFPRLFGVEGLVPGYVIVKGWPSNSGTVCGAANPNGGTYAGWAHVFMLDYALPTKGFITDAQTFNFHVETVYNDGVDPRPAGGYTDSDWTHVMMGVSTDFDLGNNLTFTPGVYHQITMEDSATRGVSPDHNITWASLTLKYSF